MKLNYSSVILKFTMLSMQDGMIFFYKMHLQVTILFLCRFERWKKFLFANFLNISQTNRKIVYSLMRRDTSTLFLWNVKRKTDLGTTIQFSYQFEYWQFSTSCRNLSCNWNNVQTDQNMVNLLIQKEAFDLFIWNTKWNFDLRATI